MLIEKYSKIQQRFIKFGQFFGLAPLTQTPSSTNFSISKIQFATSLVYVFFQVGHAIYRVVETYDKIRLTTMTDIIHFVWMFHCLLTNICVATQSLIASNHFVAFINELCNIDREMHSKLSMVANYQRHNRKYLLIMSFVIGTSFMVSWILYGFLAFYYPQLTSLFSFTFIPTAFMSIRVFQIIFSIELINDHLDTINDSLRIVDTEYGDRKWDLISLRQLYGRCWSALQLYNKCFGFSNLMLLLFYAFDVLHGIYVLFLNVHGLRPDFVVLCELTTLLPFVNFLFLNSN